MRREVEEIAVLQDERSTTGTGLMTTPPMVSPCRHYWRFAIGLFWLGLVMNVSGAEYEKIVDQKVVYWSPDRRNRAIVVYYRPWFYGMGESRINLYNRRGHLLGSEEYVRGGTQGFRVKQAAWSLDSDFFVFSVISSGGHSPWSTPMTFYDVRRRKFYSLGALAQGGVITEDQFSMASLSTVIVMGRERRTRINLRHLTTAQRESAEKGKREFFQWLRQPE
jgi:hypothetical protein